MTDQTTHHAEAILRAAEPTAWLYRNSLGHACVQFVQGLMGDGWAEEPLYTAEAILAAVREAMEAERKAVVDWLRSGAGADTTTLAKPIRALFLRGLHGYADAIEAGRHLPTPPRGE